MALEQVEEEGKKLRESVFDSETIQVADSCSPALLVQFRSHRVVARVQKKLLQTDSIPLESEAKAGVKKFQSWSEKRALGRLREGR